MAAIADSRIVIVTGVGVLGLVLGLGFGYWQQERTLALVESRQKADRAILADVVKQLGTRIDSLREELVDDRQTGQSERQHLSVRLYQLSTALDELRVLTQPVLADIPDSIIESAAPASAQ